MSQMTMRLTSGCTTKAAGGDARAARHDQHRLGLLVHQGRDVPQHALKPHVGGQGRRLDLAGAVEASHAFAGLGDGDRDIRSLADVDAVDVRFAGLVGDVLDDAGGRLRQQAGRLSAEGHERPGHRRHAPGEPAGHSQRGRQRRRAAAVAPIRRAGRSRGQSATSAAVAASPISTRSAPAVPIAGISEQAEQQRAGDRADRVGRVDAARPAARDPGRATATAARASGKLAPHRHAGGRTAQRQRTRSSWKVYQGLGDSAGTIGQ